jgi:prepilin peptidase dependent protein B
MTTRKKQAGLTIVELLVAMVLGIAIGGSILYIFVSATSANNETIRAARLEEELSALMNVMARDIRRAGYTPRAISVTIGDDVVLGDLDDWETIDWSTDGCILYQYDRVVGASNPLGGGPVLSDFSGFRLQGGSTEVQKRKRAADTLDGCSDGTWEGVTSDYAAEVTQLSFNVVTPTVDVPVVGSSTVTVNARDVEITLTGQSVSSTGQTIIRTLNETVRVRNDQLVQ